MVRTVSWRFLFGVVLLHVVLTTFLNLVVFQFKLLQPIQELTSGLVSVTLLGNLFLLGIMLSLIVFVGKIGLKDLALTPAAGQGERSILRGVIWTLIAAVLLHIVIALATLLSGSDLLVQEGSLVAGIGRLLGQIFGNALYEEIVFRAFLLPQLLVLFKKKNRKWSWNRCFLLALVVSQVIFALIHIPNRIYQGQYVSLGAVIGDQAFLIVAGLLLAAVFLLTRNLFAAVGVHALLNKSIVLLVPPTNDLILAVYLVIPAIVLWNKWQSGKSRGKEK